MVTKRLTPTGQSWTKFINNARTPLYCFSVFESTMSEHYGNTDFLSYNYTRELYSSEVTFVSFLGQNTRARATKVTFRTHKYHWLELVYPTQIYGNRPHHTIFLMIPVRRDWYKTRISVGSHRNPHIVILQWSHFADNTVVHSIIVPSRLQYWEKYHKSQLVTSTLQTFWALKQRPDPAGHRRQHSWIRMLHKFLFIPE